MMFRNILPVFARIRIDDNQNSIESKSIRVFVLLRADDYAWIEETRKDMILLSILINKPDFPLGYLSFSSRSLSLSILTSKYVEGSISLGLPLPWYLSLETICFAVWRWHLCLPGCNKSLYTSQTLSCLSSFLSFAFSQQWFLFFLACSRSFAFPFMPT